MKWISMLEKTGWLRKMEWCRSASECNAIIDELYCLWSFKIFRLMSLLSRTGNNTGCDNNDKKQPKECYIPDNQMASSPSISSGVLLLSSIFLFTVSLIMMSFYLILVLWIMFCQWQWNVWIIAYVTSVGLTAEMEDMIVVEFDVRRNFR